MRTEGHPGDGKRADAMTFGDRVLADALALAAKGFKMYPIDRDGIPFRPRSDPAKHASADPEQLKAWRARWPKAGFAILRQ